MISLEYLKVKLNQARTEKADAIDNGLKTAADQAYGRELALLDLIGTLTGGIDSVITAAECELRAREVWGITFCTDGTVELTTHAVDTWHEHGSGDTLSEAVDDLDRRLIRNPRPSGPITTGY